MYRVIPIVMSATFFFYLGNTARDYDTIEAALHWRLTQLDIGPVYPAWIPDNVDSAIVYRRRSGGRQYFLTGGTTEVQPIFALDIWGQSLAEVDAKAETIRKAISGYKGDWNGKPIHNCHLITQ